MFFAQMIGQSPLLLVYLVGMLLCGIFWRRAGTAATLAMIGLGILLVTTVGSALLQGYLLQNRMATGQSVATYAQMMVWIGIGTAVIRAFGTGLIVAGVFVGRPPVAAISSGFEVQASQPPAMPR